MTGVYVVGVGQGRFGKRAEHTVQELACEAFREAVADAGIEPRQVQACFVGAVPEYHRQRSLGGALGDYLGLHPAPVWVHEAACASGGAAVRAGWLAIRADAHELVAVLGCQKMTDLSSAAIQELMGRVGDALWEAPFGCTFPSYYALFARRHMHVHGTKPEQLARIAVKNHEAGLHNPLAMFRKRITVDQVLASPLVASPLHRFDCAANADGAACVLLASEAVARRLSPRKPRIRLQGCGAASASSSVLRAGALTHVPSIREAARQAYEQAGLAPGDVRVAQVHDAFTITELMAYEDLGFCDPGQGGRFIDAGESALGGSVPCNPDGGIKARGHPVGASGVAMVVQIVRQLRGTCGPTQVPGADVGLVHNVGGVGQYGFVDILRREA